MWSDYYDREASRLSAKLWRDKNREHYRRYQREYALKRYHEDPERERARSRVAYQKRKALGLAARTPEQRIARRIRDQVHYGAHLEEIRARSRAKYALKILKKYGRSVRRYERHK